MKKLKLVDKAAEYEYELSIRLHMRAELSMSRHFMKRFINEKPYAVLPAKKVISLS